MQAESEKWPSQIPSNKLYYSLKGTNEAFIFKREFNPSYSEDLLKSDSFNESTLEN